MHWSAALLFSLLGGSAAYTQVTAWQAESANPPIGQFAEVDGLRIHYTDQGQGRPLILVHGASTSLLDFHASIAGPLAARYRVIALDRPGHGYSERPADAWPNPLYQAHIAHGLAQGLGLERPILVGHSWAGSLVLAYLLAYPGEAAGAVLLAGGTHPWEGGVAWYNDLAGVPVLGSLFAYTLGGALGPFAIDGGIAEVLSPDPVPDGYRSRTGVDLSLRPRTFLANAEDVRRLSPFLAEQRAGYSRIQVPLLLITGDGDDLVPAWNHADRLILEAPRARQVVIPGAGHGLHHSRGDLVVGLIEDFVAETDEARGAGH
ncbi:MAG: alpha/beta hydrolase [Chromatiaceae bacterium]